MSYTPLDDGLSSSTILKHGPDVVACWFLLLSGCDKLGESKMQPSAAAGLLRISDERTEAAWETLQAPDPRSRNQEHEGRRIIRLPTGNWFVVSHQKYQWLASKERALQRQKKYDSNKAARSRSAPVDEYVCQHEGCQQQAVAAVHGLMLCPRHGLTLDGET